MREIRFRAWDTDGRVKRNKMIYNIQYGIWDDELDYGEGDWAMTFDDFLINDRYIVMQYTGLKDKNGKEIYEGDIVKFEDGVGEVFWSGDGCWKHTFIEGFEQVAGRRIVFSRPPKRFWLSEEGVEVIGNIHETPELLEGRGDEG